MDCTNNNAKFISENNQQFSNNINKFLFSTQKEDHLWLVNSPILLNFYLISTVFWGSFLVLFKVKGASKFNESEEKTAIETGKGLQASFSAGSHPSTSVCGLK